MVRRLRRLPIKGEVLSSVGDEVGPDQVVAQAMLPGVLQTVKVADKLSIEAKDVKEFLKVQVGDTITKNQVVAEGKKLFGLFKPPTATADYAGVLESISEVTGNLLLREPSIPVAIRAYIQGRVVEILPAEGVVVETRGAMVQGIFGVGGERTGAIRVAVADPDKILEASDIWNDDSGKILIGGAGMSFEAITKASSIGVTGIVAGGLRDSDLTEFLGYDIGVAITGQESIGLTLVVTEGFGFLAMAERTFGLFKSLEGKMASINGATQIRAGVIRPEIIVPIAESTGNVAGTDQSFELRTGTPVRIIREPYFGKLGTVTELPAQLVVLDSGTEVRVLRAKLSDGEVVTVPRANVEIIATQ